MATSKGWAASLEGGNNYIHQPNITDNSATTTKYTSMNDPMKYHQHKDPYHSINHAGWNTRNFFCKQYHCNFFFNSTARMIATFCTTHSDITNLYHISTTNSVQWSFPSRHRILPHPPHCMLCSHFHVCSNLEQFLILITLWHQSFILPLVRQYQATETIQDDVTCDFWRMEFGKEFGNMA